MQNLPAIRISVTFAISLLIVSGFLVTGVNGQHQVPRIQNDDEWVMDQTNSLTPAAIDHINDLCNEIKDKGGAEMVVVIIPTTRGKNYKQFALELFNLWRIGDAVEDNGILVFVAKNDRTARIVLGSGIDTAGHQQMAQQIFERAMVPELRAGDLDDAVYKAAFQAAEQILGIQDLTAPAELSNVAVVIPRERAPNNPLSPTSPSGPPGDAKNNVDKRITNPRPTTNPKRTTNPNRAVNQNRHLPDPVEAAQQQKRRRNQALAPLLWLAGGGMGLGGLALVGGRYLSRYRQRKCPKCEAELILLDEAVEDEFLEDEEQLEERIRSVKYDVWACFSCEDVIKLKYGTFLTRYSKCPSCDRKTKSKIKRTLIAATKRRNGVVQVTETCENCDYHHQYSYRTPRLPDIKSGGGSGIGGSGGSRRSSSGSRRSSGGGRSYGGGSSRGGGGGGSW